MSVTLDPPIRVGAHTVAAVARTRVMPFATGGSVMFVAEKVPLAVIVLTDGDLAVFSIEGARLSKAEVDALSPGLMAQAMALGD